VGLRPRRPRLGGLAQRLVRLGEEQPVPGRTAVALRATASRKRATASACRPARTRTAPRVFRYRLSRSLSATFSISATARPTPGDGGPRAATQTSALVRTRSRGACGASSGCRPSSCFAAPR
jgi:hypothetical protein